MRTALLLMCAAAAFGQIGAPRLGYVPEGSRIRVMNGIPAAGVVGEYLDVGRNLVQITVAPKQDYILATAADTGEVLLIVPGRAAVALAGANSSPLVIEMSPTGSSAALIYSTGRIQIVSGLPASPSIRQIDVSFLNGRFDSVAVSDDGNWLALDNDLIARDGSLSTIPLDGTGPVGVAFMRNRSTLAVVNSNRVTIVTEGEISSSFARETNEPLIAAAITLDNQRLVIAGYAGKITTIDLSTMASTVIDCGCLPAGLFGLGNAVFRLTNSGMGRVTLFDADSNRALTVPRELASAIVRRPAISRHVTAQVAQPVPALSIAGLPASTGPAQQPAMTISAAVPYVADITGTATLTFASSVGGDDQTIQFGTGGRTVNFTIPAGTTQANFSGKANVAVLTGTVAGTITIKLTVVTQGSDVTPTPPPTATIALVTTVPFIQSTQLQQSTGGFTVLITGFSTTRDMVSGLFHFAPSTNATLAASDVTVQLGAAFTTWYSNTASNALGSQFLLTVPFTTQNGLPGNIVAVTVTLTNSKGSSNPSINQ
jgi:hypothetical protein